MLTHYISDTARTDWRCFIAGLAGTGAGIILGLPRSSTSL